MRILIGLLASLLNLILCTSAPNRNPTPEILADHPDPRAVLGQVNEGYERVDSICKTFDCPSHSIECFQQVLLIPNSFANLPIVVVAMQNSSTNAQYNIYSNILYPHARILLESLVRATIDPETSAGFTSWAASMEAGISIIVEYLGPDNDVLDDCSDEKF
ncbi:hypothetical protein DPV78_004944 [Talaromyces pinophilus]|nr:hypothetical protein DPV78_004944 [Talaromyces pinophilus]